MREALAVTVKKIKNIPFHFWILGLILVVGILLRTYQFQDWMVFNPDQARDAFIITDVLDGSSSLPLLGPQSGNTRFSLGPIFYYFGIIAGFVFSPMPTVFAYPDLLFSILTLPLLFFLFRKYFSIQITLTVVALLAVSYFAIWYGRFAWNPNSIPFFTLLYLYGLTEMFASGSSHSRRGAVLTAIGLGVGIQLHAVLFVALPIIFCLAYVYIWKKRASSPRSLLLILGIVCVLNAGLIIHELQTSASNTRAFFHGATSQSANHAQLIRNIGYVAFCQIEANAHIISAELGIEDCGRGGIRAYVKKFREDAVTKAVHVTAANMWFLLEVVLAVIFSIGGYGLLVYRVCKEQAPEKKFFFLLIIVFNLVTLFILTPVAAEISLRYFIMLLPVPFILLGLWIQFLGTILRNTAVVAGLLLCIFVVTNTVAIAEMATKLQNRSASDVHNAFYGEIKPIVAFIASAMSGEGTIYIDGNEYYEKRYFMPIHYMLRKSRVHFVEIRKNTHISKDAAIIYITGATKKSPSQYDDEQGTVVEATADFNAVRIFVLRKP